MRRVLPFLFALLSLLGAVPSFAGPFRDSEARMAAAYAEYRKALFATGQGNEAASRAAVAEFRRQWSGIAATWRIVAPPQYADDERLIATLEVVAIRAEESDKAIARANLPEAHELLEGIRDELADLRLRNGTQTFSDRMNAFHAQMERLLVMGPPKGAGEDMARFRDETAVLDYLSREISRRFPPKAGALVADLRHATIALRTAVDQGAPSAIAAALKAVKPAYARLFVPFG